MLSLISKKSWQHQSTRSCTEHVTVEVIPSALLTESIALKRRTSLPFTRNLATQPKTRSALATHIYTMRTHTRSACSNTALRRTSFCQQNNLFLVVAFIHTDLRCEREEGFVRACEHRASKIIRQSTSEGRQRWLRTRHLLAAVQGAQNLDVVG